MGTPRARRYLLIASLFLSPLAPLGPSAQTAPVSSGPGPSSPPLAVTGITVVDVQEGRLLKHSTVLIVGQRIQALGPTGKVRVPRGARVIDGQHKYLIPGLWDMHFHVWEYPQVMYPLAIVNGVTGVREM